MKLFVSEKIIKLGSVFGLLLIVTSCFDSSGLTANNNSSCNNLNGDFLMSAVTCDGVSLVPTSTILSFQGGGLRSLTTGSTCTEIINWTLGSTATSLNPVGSGNLSCTSSGVDISNCNDGTISCSNTSNVDGVVNDFTGCNIADNSILTISRVVTSNHVSSFVSRCSVGENEEITLSIVD
ncbi:MAG: hypothetical protein AB8E15_05590 [Bdellovibrionales bacterium]